MAFAAINFAAQDQAGNALSAITVEVRADIPGQPLVPVYADRDGLVSLGNPFAWPDGARVTCYAEGGAYQIKVSKDALVQTWRHVANGTAGEFDIEDLLFGKRAQVRAASVAPINLAAPGASIDGVAMSAGQTFLAKDQAAAADNGIYTWNGAATPATRAPDFDSYDDHAGAIVAVPLGTLNANTLWVCSANPGGILGTTAINFARINVVADFGMQFSQAFSLFFWGVADSLGKLAVGLGRDLLLHCVGLRIGTHKLSVVQNDVWAFALGINNSVSFGIRRGSGKVEAAGITDRPRPAAKFSHDIVHALNYGQSLSIGWTSLPASLAQRFTALTFTNGTLPQTFSADPAVAYAGPLVPFVEMTRETGLIGFTDTIMELAAAENGLTAWGTGTQFMASAAGEPGQSIAQLSQGTAYFDRAVAHVHYAAQKAAAMRRTYCVGYLNLMQGEQDVALATTKAVYKPAIKTLRTDFQSAIATDVPNNPPVLMPVAQVCSHIFYAKPYPEIALAQLEACDEDSNLVLSTPTYFMDFHDEVHLTATSYIWLGAYHAYIAKRLRIDDKPREDFRVAEIVRQGNILTVRFRFPGSRLVFDTTQVVDPGNYGLVIRDNTAGADIALLQRPELVGRDRVRFECASAIPATGCMLQIGFRGASNSGRLTGARTCLRDNRGDIVDPYDPGGLALKLHAWSPILEAPIT